MQSKRETVRGADVVRDHMAEDAAEFNVPNSKIANATRNPSTNACPDFSLTFSHTPFSSLCFHFMHFFSVDLLFRPFNYIKCVVPI